MNNRKNSNVLLLLLLNYVFIISLILIINPIHAKPSSKAKHPEKFYGPSLKGSQLHSVDKSLGIENITGYVGALGDFNSDKYVDLFIVREDNSAIDVYLWNHDKYRFDLETSVVFSEDRVESVAATDFNYDGMMDLMVTLSRRSGAGGKARDITTSFYQGNHTHLEYQSSMSDIGGEGILLDANGDMHVDIFGEDKNDGNQRKYWIHDQDFNFKPQKQNAKNRLVQRGAHATVDIDGDCMADLVVVSCTSDDYFDNNFDHNNSTNGCKSQQLEIWLNTPETGEYVFNRSIALPPGAGAPSFGDMDRDGTIDIVYPVCDPEPSCSDTNAIHVLYNKQKGMCSGNILSGNNNCRTFGSLCEPSSFEFSSDNMLSVDLSSTQRRPLPSFPVGSKSIPALLRLGDYNHDAYTDLLFVTVPIAGSTGGGNARVELWENHEDKDQVHDRGLVRVTDGVEHLEAISDPVAAFFFDIDETGVFDIMVLSRPHNKSWSVHTVINNFYFDGLLLKSLGLNGVCPSDCPTDPQNPDPKPYGVNMPGITFKFSAYDLNANKFPMIGGQISQSSNLALQPPYCLFGIGRTNGYIEEFFMGVTFARAEGVHHRKFTAIIPNSQLIIIPYPVNNPDNWEILLYVNPSSQTIWVFVATLATLVLLAIPIVIFRRKEIKQDKKEAMEMFSFNAI